MTDKCPSCIFWLRCKKTQYADGTEIINWSAPDDTGLCQRLKIETPSLFGCTLHVYDEEPTRQVQITRKNGKPHMHWVMIPCPDCQGVGNAGGGACHRCAGTAKVRRYDDGFVGEEQTRLHPLEKENAEPLKCEKCQEKVDVKWVACPFCGHRLYNAQAQTVFVGLGNAGEVKGMAARRSEVKQQKVDSLRAQIDEQNERLQAP